MVAVPAAPNPYFFALMTGIELPDLADIIERPAFVRDALCIEYPSVDFFPERGHPLDPARSVCARCLVREACVQYALDHDEMDGVWGGTSGKQRRHARREGWTAQELLDELAARTGDTKAE